MANTIANVLHSDLFKDHDASGKYLTSDSATGSMQFDFDKITKTPEELVLPLKGGVMSKTTREWAESLTQELSVNARKAISFITAENATDIFFERGRDDDADNICSGLDELDCMADSPDIHLGLKYYRNIAKYGYATAVEWREANWGCKWNAAATLVYPGSIVFQTPNTPPVKAILQLSRDNPDQTFYLMYADEYLENGGTKVFKDGRVCDYPGYRPLQMCWKPYDTESFTDMVDEFIETLLDDEGDDDE